MNKVTLEAQIVGQRLEFEKYYGWYLLSIKPNAYRLAEENLARQGFGVFSPKHNSTKKKGSRFLNHLQPLFPGYLFAEVSKSSPEVKVLNYTRGVNKIISFTDRYHPLKKSLVEKLRLHCDADGVFSHEFSFKSGDRVKIEHGPFTSFFGKIISAKSSLRVQVLLEFLSFNAKTEISTSNISIISR
tara:strand:- start:67 stop:624 length:558 start_codon:yes stop_codon:yes gene_type:complete